MSCNWLSLFNLKELKVFRTTFLDSGLPNMLLVDSDVVFEEMVVDCEFSRMPSLLMLKLMVVGLEEVTIFRILIAVVFFIFLITDPKRYCYSSI